MGIVVRLAMLVLLVTVAVAFPGQRWRRYDMDMRRDCREIFRNQEFGNNMFTREQLVCMFWDGGAWWEQDGWRGYDGYQNNDGYMEEMYENGYKK